MNKKIFYALTASTLFVIFCSFRKLKPCFISVLSLIIAIFIIGPCIANPTPIEQAYAQDLQAPPPVAQNVQLQPLHDIEQIDVSLTQVATQQDIEKDALQTKPSSGDIEKNSSQEPYDKSNLAQQIIPETKSELFRVALMFLKVMLAVITSSVVIYFLLLFVRKFYSAPQMTEQTSDSKGGLKSPQGESEALKTFLNQTKNH